MINRGYSSPTSKSTHNNSSNSSAASNNNKSSTRRLPNSVSTASTALLSAAIQQQFMREKNVKIPKLTKFNQNIQTASNIAQHKNKNSANARTSSTNNNNNNNIQIPNYTLSQHLGLEPIPPPPLINDQWQLIIEQAHQRDCPPHSISICSICTEGYKYHSSMLILSCSHIFHPHCLRSFERFSGHQIQTCPLCRCKNYQSKVIENFHRNFIKQTSIIKIQSIIRMYKERKKYKKMLELIIPTDPIKREEWYFKRFANSAAAIITLQEHKDAEIDSLFAELDRSVEQSRLTMKSIDSRLKVYEDEEWSKIREVAMSRNITECAFCANSIHYASNAANTHARASHKHQALVLLSCSHIFHSRCLNSYESFIINSNLPNLPNAAPKPLLCCLCRAPYQKITLQEEEE